MLCLSWWKRKNKSAGNGIKITDEVLNTTREKFTEFDSNDNGAIDRDELAGLLKALHLENLVAKLDVIEKSDAAVPKPGKGKVAKKAAPAPAAAAGAKITALPPGEEILGGEVLTEDSSSLVKGIMNLPGALIKSVLPPGAKSVDGHQWSGKDATLTAEGLQWNAGGALAGAIPAGDIGRVNICQVPKEVGSGFEVVREVDGGENEIFVFAVEDDDERDEWIDSLKMIVMQSPTRQGKKQAALDARAKSKGKSAEQVKALPTMLDVAKSGDVDAAMRAKIKQAFDAFDADGGGSLDIKELEALSKSLGKLFTPEDLKAAMAEMDADKSGSVDYDEFEKYWLKTFSGDLVAGSKLAATIAQWMHVEQMHGVGYHPDRYVDHDDEFRARVWTVFDEIDGNHDHHITYIEFISWWKKKDKELHHGKSQITDEQLVESQKKFQEFDSNDNGTIDRDELAGLLRALDLLDLVPTMDDLADTEPHYKVNIHTASFPDAGTDSKVHIILYGENGDSGKRVLTTERNLLFERGQISTFKVACKDIGEIKKIKIGIDGKGTENPAWFLDKVRISQKQEKGASPEVEYLAERWLNKAEGNAVTAKEIELVPGDNRLKSNMNTNHDKIMYTNPVYGPAGVQVDASSLLNQQASKSRTVSIIGAKDLINVDTFDMSDPYCIVKFNGKTIGQTKVVDNTLFPRWMEDFEIELDESSEGIMKLELYDHDRFGAHDPLGSCEIMLGGNTNPRALLQPTDFTFPDDRYTGCVTISVSHSGGARFATEEQHMFKDKWMPGMSYREHREKHIFEDWYRTYVLICTAVLGGLSIGVFGLSIYLVGCDDHDYLSTLYLILSMFTIACCAIGFYGAWRVKGDVLAEEESSKGDEATGDDDDGLQTTGQNILQIFNAMAVIVVVLWSVLSAESFALEDNNNGGDCESQADAMFYLGVLGILSTIALCVATYCVVMIVSFFEILQTLAEFINLFLLVLSILVMIMVSFILKQEVCLTPKGESYWSGDVLTYFFLLIFAVSSIACAFYGYYAAYQEAKPMLLIHGIALGIVGFFGVCIIGMVAMRGVDEWVDDNCPGLLENTNEEFWKTTFACEVSVGTRVAPTAE